MLTATKPQVKTQATIARLEEAYETRCFALKAARRARICGEWQSAEAWDQELAGVEREIAALKSALDVSY